MPDRPLAVAFDVLGTLFSLEPLRARLVAIGLPGHALETWIAHTLRDGLAMETAGDFKPFREVAAGALAALMDDGGIEPKAEAIASALAGFEELTAFADVDPGLGRLQASGIKVAALSNGAAETTRKLLERAGVAGHISRVISIDELHHWKPAREVYLGAAKILGVPPDRMAMVAAHPWDLQGAMRAGLIGVWVPRKGSRYQEAMPGPTLASRSIDEAVGSLLGLG